MFNYRLPIFLVLGLLTACMSAPVQEMSDARQAIESAIAVGADSQSNPAMHEAEQLMEQAREALGTRQYRNARRMALAAKKKAISARVVVQNEPSYQGSSSDQW